MDERSRGALELFQKSREGFLGTLEENAKPYVSAVSAIYESSLAGGPVYGRVYLLLSDLARHTRNLQKNPDASLLVLDVSSDKPFYERPRATATGRAHYVKDAEQVEKLKKLYLEKFPGTAQLLTFKDFNFFALEIAEIHFIAGFGQISTFK